MPKSVTVTPLQSIIIAHRYPIDNKGWHDDILQSLVCQKNCVSKTTKSTMCDGAGLTPQLSATSGKSGSIGSSSPITV